MFNVKEILEITKGTIIGESSDTCFTGISIDSRTIKPGELFIAVKGERFDGHDFVEEVLSGSLGGVIVSKSWSADNAQIILKSEKPIIEVSDTVEALGLIARVYRGRFDIPMIAVTGSNGKTTTKEMIYQILLKEYAVLKSKGSFNNHFGVPLTALELSSDYKAAVFEIGMNHSGEIRCLAPIVSANIAVITNIGAAHMEFFDSISDIIEAKCELLEGLKENDYSIVNGDCKALLEYAQKYASKLITFGTDDSCQYQAQQVQVSKEGVEFLLNGEILFKLPLQGEYNVYNALAAIAVADIMQVPMKIIQEALAVFEPVNLRMQQVEIADVLIYADCYNANPDSMQAAINTFSRMNGQRKILVLADMKELGNKSEQYHRMLGQIIADYDEYILITVGNDAALIAEEAIARGMGKNNVFSSKTAIDAAHILEKIIKPKDIVLIKGSRAMKLEIVIEELRKESHVL